MKASINDVANRAGVSVVTVSRVLNNAPTVRESNRQKVLKAIEELNYQPNEAARTLARGKTNVIGILIPNLGDSFIMEVVESVTCELEREGYFLALSVIQSDTIDSNKDINFLFQHERVDGMLVITPMFEEEYIVELKKRRIPFVFIDNQRYPFIVPSIVVDNFKGGYDAGRHLIELGHTKIAHIGGPENLLSAAQREDGCRSALKEVGLDFLYVSRGDFDIKNGFDTTIDIIESGKMPTAIFAGDDNIAFGVIDALRVSGIRIPEDVSVIGFDDHPFASLLHPFLTSVRQPSTEAGKKGVKTLLEIMRGEQKKNTVIKLEPRLIERESTSLARETIS